MGGHSIEFANKMLMLTDNYVAHRPIIRRIDMFWYG